VLAQIYVYRSGPLKYLRTKHLVNTTSSSINLMLIFTDVVVVAVDLRWVGDAERKTGSSQ